MKRLNFLRLALAATLSTCWLNAGAQSRDWPQAPMKIIVPFGAGSGADQVARFVGLELTKALGQPVVIDNKPGAGGNIGASAAARSAPDGLTLFLTTNTTQAANPFLYKQLPYDPIKDFVPIGRIANTPALLVVHPAVPANNLSELMALAKSKPGKLSYASGSAGTLVPGAMLSFEADVEMVHVPYKSIPDGLKDVMAGTVDMMFTDMATGSVQVKAGRVKALGVSSAKPSALMPEVPAIASTLKGFELLAWYAMYAPAGTPQVVVDRLNQVIVTAMAKPDMIGKFSALGLEPMTSTPKQLAEFNLSELEKWGRVIKKTGATPQ
ncbi:MAG: tripartite tricarboxylate transporter substrate binding protein [Pseudomonadota bacterium]|jgi:tripartite-type tricarboxylate transporter receptor subunit TctC